MNSLLHTTGSRRTRDHDSFDWSRVLFKTIWIVFSIALLVGLLFLAFEHLRLSGFGRKFFASLVYSAWIGIPSSFLMNWVGFRLGPKSPRGTMLLYLAVLALMATVGTAAGAFLLQTVHMIAPHSAWQEFRDSYAIALVITLVMGLSIASFETLRHRLEFATLELRTRQMEQERANKLLAEARLSSLESRIHPHFLFNTLNSIAALIPSDPKHAEDTVSKLASLLRFSLGANHDSLVPLAQELKIVRDYLEIETTRFGCRLRYEIAVPEAFGMYKVPPLAVQMLVENSVKHVVARRAEGASIQITATKEESCIHLKVVDDGPGFSLAGVSPEHGLGNLSARLELLFGDSGRLDVSRAEDKTVACITFPAES